MDKKDLQNFLDAGNKSLPAVKMPPKLQIYLSDEMYEEYINWKPEPEPAAAPTPLTTPPKYTRPRKK